MAFFERVSHDLFNIAVKGCKIFIRNFNSRYTFSKETFLMLQLSKCIDMLLKMLPV